MKNYWVLAVLILAFGIGVSFFTCSSSGGGDDNSAANDDDAADDDTSGCTWTDSSSGLTWHVTLSSFFPTWDEAKSYCENLALCGGGWHLPTISELRTLIRGCEGTVTGGSCGVTDSCLDLTCRDESCHSCIYGGGPTGGCFDPSDLPGECHVCWSSSAVTDDVGDAWRVDFDDGDVSYNIVGATLLARCVR